ncbi:MAG: CBS domain-containing protein [Ketobacter sp.]|nr:CBS domain-containing protein [Ketobacter sp.]
MHVLLADDQPQVRSALRLVLEHESEMQVVGEVVNTEALLTQIKTTNPDLILLDWELPGLSKSILLSTLRKDFPYLSIIALSGQLGARRNAIEAGVDAFVSKGDPPEHLLEILHEIRNGGKVIMKKELVQDWMTSEIVTISKNTTLPNAHRLMSEHQIRRLPVMKGDRLVGIVTRGDVREAEPSDATTLSIWELNYLLANLKVKQLMTVDPLTISQKATLGQAAKMMLENKISGLPVVKGNGDVVGMITESDIFRAVVQKWSDT